MKHLVKWLWSSRRLSTWLGLTWDFQLVAEMGDTGLQVATCFGVGVDGAARWEFFGLLVMNRV